MGYIPIGGKKFVLLNISLVMLQSCQNFIISLVLSVLIEITVPIIILLYLNLRVYERGQPLLGV